MNALSVAALSAVVVFSLPLAAQEPRTGVSTPPPAMTDSVAAGDAGAVDGYRPTPTAGLQRREAVKESGFVEATATPPPAETQALGARTVGAREDVDAGIVTSVAHGPDELPVGTTFKARMRQTLSTASTQTGTPFSAELIAPVEQNGRILIPVGTVVEGRVTEVRGGRRVRGTAALHLEPSRLILPDGSQRMLHAQVIDTDQNFATRIDGEGTIVRRDHIKATLGVLGATTGASAVAGAVIGGGVGAVVGAGIGAGIGTAWWLKQDRQTVLPEETAVVFSLNEALEMGSTLR